MPNHAARWILSLAFLPGLAGAGWNKTAFPSYMSVTCLAEGRPGEIWAGTAANGMQRTVDGGETWTRVASPWGYSHATRAIAVGPLKQIYATNGTAVTSSFDQGATWSAPTTPPILGSVGSLAYDSADGILYAGGRNGICAGGEAAAGWKHMGLHNETVNAILIGPAVFINPAKRVYLGCAGVQPGLGGVYISDPVSTWSFTGAMYSDVTAMAMTREVLYLGITNSTGVNVIGTKDLNGSAEYYNFGHGLANGAPTRSLVLAKDGNLWCGQDKGVFRSTDGTNWTLSGLDSLKVTALAVSGDAVYAGTPAQGVYRFTPGNAIDPGPRGALPLKGAAGRGYDAQGRRQVGKARRAMNFTRPGG
jgi:hypothetical protein